VAYAAQESWVQNDTIKVWDVPDIHRLRSLTAVSRTTSCSGPRMMTLGTSKVSYDALLHPSRLIESRGQVLHECALERDLKLFKAGDDTEVGEKGLTLR
jgi:hypothetical protein